VGALPSFKERLWLFDKVRWEGGMIRFIISIKHLYNIFEWYLVLMARENRLPVTGEPIDLREITGQSSRLWENYHLIEKIQLMEYTLN
jgi:hypothetical protein